MSCNNNSKRITKGSFDLEGVFVKDSIPDGVIKYYKKNTNNLVATREFKNGLLNGPSINYHGEKKIQTLNYMDGLANGFSELYDSATGIITNREYYYNDRRIGPSFQYNLDGSLMNYQFDNFENKSLYQINYNTQEKKFISDDIDKLVNINISEDLVDNEEKLKIFFYTIYPPKQTVVYKLIYYDAYENAIDSVDIQNSGRIFWEGFLSLPSNDQKLAFVISRFDSIGMRNQASINYLIGK